MNITAVIKSGWHRDLRISNGNRWLIWDELEDAWIVNEKEYRKHVQRLITTKDEAEAIKYLLYEDED